MPLRAIRAVFMRGGTSKALIFRADDLPAAKEAWAPIFLAAMGSPDPNMRQLDGMGGGAASVSTVCVMGAPSRPDADVDYTFAQVAIHGVAGTGAPIRLDFTDPGGATTGRLSPTGNPTDALEGPGLGTLRAALMRHLANLRKAAAVRMGLVPDLASAERMISIPKVGILSVPVASTLLPGRRLDPHETDIVVRHDLGRTAAPCRALDRVALFGRSLPSARNGRARARTAGLRLGPTADRPSVRPHSRGRGSDERTRRAARFACNRFPHRAPPVPGRGALRRRARVIAAPDIWIGSQVRQA